MSPTAQITTFERKKNKNDKNFSFKDIDGQFIFPCTPTTINGGNSKNQNILNQTI